MSVGGEVQALNPVHRLEAARGVVGEWDRYFFERLHRLFALFEKNMSNSEISKC